MMPGSPTSQRTARTEHAFSIVEVLIAMLLLGAIASGIALAFTTGSKLEQRRDLASRMTAASERVYEHLRTNKDWVDGCRRSGPAAAAKTCHPFEALSSSQRAKLAKDDILDTTFVISSAATGIDNDGDGVGRADQDGNPDDFFRISITVQVAKADAPRIGSAKAYTVTSVINGSTNSESGALVVSFCGAANQVDERIQIASCPQTYTWFDMPDCAGTKNCAPRALLPGTPPASPLTASRMVAMQPVSPPIGSIRLRKVGGEGAGATYSGSAAAVQVAAGVYRFSDLPTGTYQVYSYSVSGWIDWETHHIPSTKEATVERQRTAMALIALKRPGASGTFRMKFDRQVRERFLGAMEKTFTTPWIPECEQPASFNQTAFYATTVTCSKPHMTVVMRGGGSMTASAEGLTNDVHVYESDGHFREIVTVKYIGEVNRKEYIWNGAAGSALFSTQPEPAGRYTERSEAGGGASYTIPTSRWKQPISAAPWWDVAKGASNTTADGIGTGSISKVPLGLNAPIRNEKDSVIGNVFRKYEPAGCETRYTWIRPDGGFGTCSSLHFRGDRNECYTTLNPNWTGISYNRVRGCGKFYWPPRGGTISQSGRYLVVQVCRQRQSRVSNIRDQDLIGYDAIGGYSAEEWLALMEGYGYTGYTTGSHTLGGRTVSNTRAYRDHRPKDQLKTFNLGCLSSPSVAVPFVCNQLDDWTNCEKAIVVTIPATPGWGTAGDVQDGHRPNRSGGSIKALGA